MAACPSLTSDLEACSATIAGIRNHVRREETRNASLVPDTDLTQVNLMSHVEICDESC